MTLAKFSSRPVVNIPRHAVFQRARRLPRHCPTSSIETGYINMSSNSHSNNKHTEKKGGERPHAGSELKQLSRQAHADELVAKPVAMALANPFDNVAPCMSPTGTMVVSRAVSVLTTYATAGKSTVFFLQFAGNGYRFNFNQTLNESAVPDSNCNSLVGDNDSTLAQAYEGRIAAAGIRVTRMDAEDALPGYVTMGLSQPISMAVANARSATKWRAEKSVETRAAPQSREMVAAWRAYDVDDEKFTVYTVGVGNTAHTTFQPFVMLSGYPVYTPVMVEFVVQIECQFTAEASFADPTRAGWGVSHDWGTIMDLVESKFAKQFSQFLTWGVSAAVRHGVRSLATAAVSSWTGWSGFHGGLRESPELTPFNPDTFKDWFLDSEITSALAEAVFPMVSAIILKRRAAGKTDTPLGSRAARLKRPSDPRLALMASAHTSSIPQAASRRGSETYESLSADEMREIIKQLKPDGSSSSPNRAPPKPAGSSK